MRSGTEKHKLQSVAKKDSQLSQLTNPPILESIHYHYKLQHMSFLAPIKTVNMHKENNFRAHGK